jgi:hypothetical protein
MCSQIIDLGNCFALYKCFVSKNLICQLANNKHIHLNKTVCFKDLVAFLFSIISRTIVIPGMPVADTSNFPSHLFFLVCK